VSDHHWQEGREPDPDHHFGFVYEIGHLSTGRKYIGYKQYWFSSGKVKYRVKDIKSSKWNKLAWKPSDWRDYTSSSKDLNIAIAEFGKDDFEFKILGQYTNSRDMRYQEVRQLVLRDALTLVDSDGEYVYYNKSIPDIKFRPPTTVSEETRAKMRENSKGQTHNRSECFDAVAEPFVTGHGHHVVDFRCRGHAAHSLSALTACSLSYSVRISATASHVRLSTR